MVGLKHTDVPLKLVKTAADIIFAFYPHYTKRWTGLDQVHIDGTPPTGDFMILAKGFRDALKLGLSFVGIVPDVTVVTKSARESPGFEDIQIQYNRIGEIELDIEQQIQDMINFPDTISAGQFKLSKDKTR